MHFSPGYASLYTKVTTTTRAKRLINLIQEYQRKGITSFVVSGNSGVSVAFAALMLHDFNLFLVRKDNDNSHGAPMEGPANVHLGDYVILDDMVDSGSTVLRVVDRIESLHRAIDLAPPHCVGVALYTSEYPDRVKLTDGTTVPCNQG